MFDDDERVTRFEQLAQGTHQLGDVVEVQPGGRFVEQEKRALARQVLAAVAGGLGGFGQEAREFEALRFAARERGHGLAQAHVLQAHVNDGLQGADDFSVLREQGRGFADGEFQNVRDVEPAGLAAHGLALDLDLQNFGAVALAIAVGAAQVHVREKLHFDMLKTRSAAGRAAAIAAVEAELAGGVAALTRLGGGGEEFPDGVPGAHIAHGVGAGRLADRRLVHKHHIAQVIGPQQAVMRAGRFGGLAEVAHQGRGQHVLDQARLARATDAGDGDQALQRKVDRHILQVVLAGALQNQPRRAVGDHALETQADLLAGPEVSAGQGVGAAQRLGAAVEDDLATAFTGAGAHVDHAVGGKHHGRVVFDHHQGVAGVAQAVHGLGDAAHVARVQADAGFVQHKQGVDQAGAQRGGEVDALDFAPAQGAALAVEREVADAHVAQVFEPCRDFFQKQLQGFVLCAFCALVPAWGGAGRYASFLMLRRSAEIVRMRTARLRPCR